MAFGQPFYAYGGNGYNTQNNGYVAPQPQYGNFYGQPQNAPQNTNNGVYLVRMDGHISTVIDGVSVDIFDCTKEIVTNAWRVW